MASIKLSTKLQVCPKIRILLRSTGDDSEVYVLEYVNNDFLLPYLSLGVNSKLQAIYRYEYK
jgi:hypothetical protein